MLKPWTSMAFPPFHSKMLRAEKKIFFQQEAFSVRSLKHIWAKQRYSKSFTSLHNLFTTFSLRLSHLLWQGVPKRNTDGYTKSVLKNCMSMNWFKSRMFRSSYLRMPCICGTKYHYMLNIGSICTKFKQQKGLGQICRLKV